MDYKEMKTRLDRVIVNNKELKQIFKWQKEEKVKLDEKIFFPLNVFVLDVESHKDEWHSTIIELDNFDVRNMKCTSEGGNVFTVKRGENNDGFQFDGQGYGMTQDMIEGVFAIYLGILCYISQKARERTERVSPMVTRQERENYEYKERECFLLNDIVKYVSIHPNRKSIQYRCECWGVRGHIRHLKNGDMIFIKPFKKGRKRDVLEPKSKTYLLGGKDDV